jgi:hypothetical protein
MLIFVVARSRLGRYEELRRQLEELAGCKGYPRPSGRVASRAPSRACWGREAASGATSTAARLEEAWLVCVRSRRTRLMNPVNLLSDLEDFVHDHRLMAP